MLDRTTRTRAPGSLNI
ncbi:unnamed protein product [Lasius platythorax]|uniref:Uncharacterized protein n=1 Tax=Lasius platythorax TaxID=488582 RepID=A0AAV2NPQ3_9HYME